MKKFEVGQKVIMMVPVECTIIEQDGKFVVVRIDDYVPGLSDMTCGRFVEVPEGVSLIGVADA